MIGRVARGLARRAGARFFRLFARPLDSGAWEPPAGVHVRLLREDQLSAWSADPDLALRPEGVAAGYARGDFCVGAFESDLLVGYCCFAFAPLPHLDGVWVDFDRDVAWTYKSLVRPAHRGRGIAPALYRFADAACRERGRLRSVICVEAHNAPSVRAALHAGYRQSGYAAYHCGGGLRVWCSPGTEAQGVRFFLPVAE